MRVYPFGSSSLNVVYNPTAATTASLARYADAAQYGIRVVTASHAIDGVRGTNGNNGVCLYTPGPTGDKGPDGFGGGGGGVSVAYPSGSGY